MNRRTFLALPVAVIGVGTVNVSTSTPRWDVFIDQAPMFKPWHCASFNKTEEELDAWFEFEFPHMRTLRRKFVPNVKDYHKLPIKYDVHRIGSKNQYDFTYVQMAPNEPIYKVTHRRETIASG